MFLSLHTNHTLPCYNNSESELIRMAKILVVEDDKNTNDVICDFLVDAGAGREFCHTAKITQLQEKFREEIIERWGETESYQEFASLFGEKARTVQGEQWGEFLTKTKTLFEHLAEYEDKYPSEQELQSIVWQWKEYISENFYQCDNQMLMYLGELYTTDDRFKEFINRFGNGDLADFFNKAIIIFCSVNN